MPRSSAGPTSAALGVDDPALRRLDPLQPVRAEAGQQRQPAAVAEPPGGPHRARPQRLGPFRPAPAGGEPGGELLGAQAQQHPGAGEPAVVGGAVLLAPVELGAGEGGLGQGVRHRGLRVGEEARELARPALAHRLAEVAVEVAEVLERDRRPPLLAHEQHGTCGESRRSDWAAWSALGSTSSASRSPSARLPIWSWFWRKSTKAKGGRLPEGSPRLLPPACSDGSPW